MNEFLSTQGVAKKLGIHRDTLLRWLREGKIPEPKRDRNGWRLFSSSDLDNIKKYSTNTIEEPSVLYRNNKMNTLESIDWNFADAKTGYLTHSVHPYPAKFIPQIPKTLIRELASIGDTILDPFCGSGTTLVEALRLECNAIGIDANPLACLISRAKTTTLDEDGVTQLIHLVEETLSVAQEIGITNTPLFKTQSTLIKASSEPPFDGVEDWFDNHVIKELIYIKAKCLALPHSHLQDIALAAFSSIIITVSRQDSDTRYVRREKNTKPGDSLRLFAKSLKDFVKRSLELSEEIVSSNTVNVYQSNILNPPNIPNVDLVVCSPPYPNAYSYHLYHRTRMLWLGMDQPQFKQDEIGSHRKYSSKGKNKATVETFKSELHTIMKWLSQIVKSKGHVCFVIGDSTLGGIRVENDQLLIEIATSCGFKVDANINRALHDKKKSFNPKIGKIRDEHIVILSNHSL